MAGHDRTKWDYILNLPLYEFLFTMVFFQEQSKKERQEAEKKAAQLRSSK